MSILAFSRAAWHPTSSPHSFVVSVRGIASALLTTANNGHEAHLCSKDHDTQSCYGALSKMAPKSQITPGQNLAFLCLSTSIPLPPSSNIDEQTTTRSMILLPSGPDLAKSIELARSGSSTPSPCLLPREKTPRHGVTLP